MGEHLKRPSNPFGLGRFAKAVGLEVNNSPSKNAAMDQQKIKEMLDDSEQKINKKKQRRSKGSHTNGDEHERKDLINPMPTNGMNETKEEQSLR